MDCSTPGFSVNHQLPEPTQTHIHPRRCHLIVSSCDPLLLLPSIFPSIRVFSNESVLLIRWPKFWSFSFYISPSREHSRLIPFRIDWFDLLGSSGGSDGKNNACNMGDWGSVPGQEDHPPGEVNGYPFQYSCLENSMDRGPGRLQFMESQRVGHDCVTNTFTLNLYLGTP